MLSTIPVPGCRTVAQVEQNAGAIEFWPLSAEMSELDDQLRSEARTSA